MKNHFDKLTSWLVGASMLLGLSQAAHAQAHLDAREGWRSAYVLQTIGATDAHHLVASANDCRTHLSSSARDERVWVLLRYRRVPGDVYRIVPVASGSAIAGGQTVDVNVNRCDVLQSSPRTQG